ncbi:MAG: RHS repeat-associated protein [Vicingaceae bacterium]|jgi:RHS repeat-associated protein
MQMPGRGFTSGDGYRYGFNGMERDDEVSGSGNSYDFGARIYDSRIGRWLTNDPYAKKYPSLSPYTAFGNNPIYYIDPSGETLRVAGSSKTNIETAKLDMIGLLPPPKEGGVDYSTFLTVGDKGVVEFNITKAQAEASGDVGVEYLYKITTSPSHFTYSVEDELQVFDMKSLKPMVKKKIANFTLTDKTKGGVPSNQKPIRIGVDGVLNIPKNLVTINEDGSIEDRRSTVLHEIIEMLESQDGGLLYFSKSSPYINGNINMGDPEDYPEIGSHDKSIDAVTNGTNTSAPIKKGDPRYDATPGKAAKVTNKIPKDE